MNHLFKILVVDDEQDYRDVLDMLLKSKGYDVKTFARAEDALEAMEQENYDLVISDLIMPEMDGVDLLEAIKSKYPDVVVIIMTAFGTIENAVDAMKKGAFTYIIKGNSPEELLMEIENIMSFKQLKDENIYMKEKISNIDYMLESKNLEYNRLLKMAEKAANSDINILITGESGAGKEVIARHIHAMSPRKNNLFMDINCHAFSDNLLESELFGHEKGAFTGAVNKRIGRFEASNGGTLFLDEIGDISFSTQSKILRAIETKKIYRIGKNEAIPVNFRLITATNKNLEEEIEADNFREDLFYRLSTIILEIPPLRKRREDISLLIDYFLKKCQLEMKIKITKVEEDVYQFLKSYHYPGNIRELKNIIERLVVLSEEGTIKKESLPTIKAKSEENEFIFEGGCSLKDVRREIESQYIKHTLGLCDNNYGKTAVKLGISRRQLFNKMTEYGLKEEEK
ncbi:MAG: sigma-54 dependent transcriptional regulator [Clostridia bacterium]|nr:sigma-54 dependent transcriptional regulator [Clostridia bacterium]